MRKPTINELTELIKAKENDDYQNFMFVFICLDLIWLS